MPLDVIQTFEGDIFCKDSSRRNFHRGKKGAIQALSLSHTTANRRGKGRRGRERGRERRTNSSCISTAQWRVGCSAACPAHTGE